MSDERGPLWMRAGLTFTTASDMKRHYRIEPPFVVPADGRYVVVLNEDGTATVKGDET